MQAYSNPACAADPFCLPNVEVFHMSASDLIEWLENEDSIWFEIGTDLELDGTTEETAQEMEGWYWWTCLPGCLPDSAPSGPLRQKQRP